MPSTYLRLAEAHLSHNRTSFEVLLSCVDDDLVDVLVHVAATDIPRLAPYLVLLRDSVVNPVHTEPPVVPVIRGESGVWSFCGDTASHDQEIVPPEPVASAPPSPSASFLI